MLDGYLICKISSLILLLVIGLLYFKKNILLSGCEGPCLSHCANKSKNMFIGLGLFIGMILSGILGLIGYYYKKKLTKNNI